MCPAPPLAPLFPPPGANVPHTPFTTQGGKAATAKAAERRARERRKRVGGDPFTVWDFEAAFVKALDQ